MTRQLGLLLALSLVALLVAPAVARDAPPPKLEVKTGLRVVATIRYSGGARPARPTLPGKGTIRAAGGLPVKIFPEEGNKAVAEVKTDGNGVCVVSLPAGKYRVVAVAFADTPARRQEKSAGVEVKEGAVSEIKLKFSYALR